MSNSLIGETIGSYRILRQLGQGGMGAVFLAEHVVIGRKAALKLLLPQFSANAEMVARMFNEARAAALIDHPGLVDIYDVGTHTNKCAYLVMEFLDGESLSTRLRRDRKLSNELTVALSRQIAAAVGAANGKGIVHRDLKPDNLFLVADQEIPCGFRVRVLDFGIAKLNEGGDDNYKTRTGVLMGTPVYMSPEQCRGAGHTDHRSDIYSLGCVMFEMLSGRPPFVKEGQGELIGAHQFEPAPPLSMFAPRAPKELQRLIADMLTKDVTRRPQSMPEVIDRLRPLASMTPPMGRHVSDGRLQSATTTPVLAPPKVGTTLPMESVSPVIGEAVTRRRAAGRKGEALNGRRLFIGGTLGAALIATGVALWTRAPAPRPVEEPRPDPLPGTTITTTHGDEHGATGMKEGGQPARDVIDDPAPHPVNHVEPPTKVVPPLTTVKLTIDSRPRGAAVSLAATHESVGVTPCEYVAPASEAKATFLLKHAGFRDAQVRLSMRRDGATIVDLKAMAAAGGKAGGAKATVLDPFETKP